MAESSGGPVLRESEVVFMYSASEGAYRAYGTTFVGWGHAGTPEAVKMHHDLGIRCTGTIWCLTAGAERIHNDPAFREAVVRDIEGSPVEVPWLFDQVYKGTRTYFGCTNHPTFRKLNRELAREAMAGRPDGLHIDDPRGTATPAVAFGGGFCDHCMAKFREYLKTSASPEQLREAGTDDLDAFDYRDVVRRFATTREKYLQVHKQIPLMDLFQRFHCEAAAENIRGIAKVAEEAAGRPILLSVNAYMMEETFLPILRLDEVTHVICEVSHGAQRGTELLGSVVGAYEKAQQLGKPVAVTGSGQDWAWVKAHGAVDLVKVWIALAYACGQRFMVPHPTRQWCMTPFLGTHWYAAPIEEFAPIYRFLRANERYFDGYSAVEHAEIAAPEGVVCTAREKPGAPPVVHVVNTRYVPRSEGPRLHDHVPPGRDVPITLPAALAGDATQATLLSYDADPQTVPLRAEGAKVSLQVPEVRIWTMIIFE